MVILAQRWAERYMEEHPGSAIQVAGGGTGTGLASLINGTTDIAAASRPITDRERRNLRRNRGVDARETSVAIDAVAIYVHADNLVRPLTLPELSRVFRGRARNWSELGGPNERIVLYSRENNSGTYAFFKEHVLSNADFATSAQTLPGTAAVINVVSHDRRGIGYGGIGYGEGVRAVPILVDGVAVAPDVNSASDGRYPLARPLLVYTAGEPRRLARDFIEWVRSPDGQRLVRDAGYFPLRAGVGAADHEGDSP
jgi:phosphate transport system substrate-binding protein